MSMDKISRILLTSSGTDKCLMLVQYTSLLLSKIGDDDRQSGRNRNDVRRPAQRFGALSSLISETRTTIRLLDLLSVIQWWKSLKNKSQGSLISRCFDLERLEVISMLFYYPLEHVYFLTSKSILPCSTQTAAKASLYSCRAWAIYTFLHFGFLWKNFREIRRQEEIENDDEKKVNTKRFQERKAVLINSLIVNMAYAPLTLHWSLRKGVYESESITALCGIVAALGQLRATWKATK